MALKQISIQGPRVQLLEFGTEFCRGISSQPLTCESGVLTPKSTLGLRRARSTYSSALSTNSISSIVILTRIMMMITIIMIMVMMMIMMTLMMVLMMMIIIIINNIIMVLLTATIMSTTMLAVISMISVLAAFGQDRAYQTYDTRTGSLKKILRTDSSQKGMSRGLLLERPLVQGSEEVLAKAFMMQSVCIVSLRFLSSA